MSRKLIAALGVAGFLASAGAAFAQTTTPTTATVPHAQQMMLQISPSGRTLLRGTVESVSSGAVTVKSWGGAWTVNVPTTAEVLPRGVALTDFKAGDFVGVQGTADEHGSWTVNATLVRDWTARQALHQEIKANAQEVHKAKAAGERTIQGTISVLDPAGKTFTLTTSGGASYSVSLASAATLIAKNGTTLDFGKVSNGDTVRVYGTVSSTTIAASIFRDVSVK